MLNHKRKKQLKEQLLKEIAAELYPAKFINKSIESGDKNERPTN